MSHVSRFSQAVNADKEPLLNDNGQADDYSKSEGEAVRILHGQSIEERTQSPTADDNAKHVTGDNVEINQLLTVHLTNPNQNKPKNMKTYYAWQFVCLLFVSLTIYETYQNALPNYNYEVPKRFFPSGSATIDYRRGDLTIVENQVARADITLVLFYAPWSAESQRARTIYETVAQQFNNRIPFVAINCWQPDGECRHRYKKVVSWPVLMVYTRNNVGVPYHGQWQTSALTKFVYNIMRPIQRIYTPAERLEQSHKYDAVAVLFVDMATNRTSYDTFYRTALKWLEHDPYGDVGFMAVIGKPAIAKFEIDNTPLVRLYLWNDTLDFIGEKPWKIEVLHDWIHGKLQKASRWLSPPGERSRHLNAFIRKGPILILFTPRNLYHTTHDAYSMLRQVSMDYNNCQYNDSISQLTHLNLYADRQQNYENSFNMLIKCNDEYLFEQLNGSSGKDSFLDLILIFARMSPMRKKLPNIFAQLNNQTDKRSASNVAHLWRGYDCDLNRLAMDRQKAMFADHTVVDVLRHEHSMKHAQNSITGMACRTNKTLSFLAMDTSHYRLFAQRLGVSVNEKNAHTAAVIVNSKDETTHVLNQPLTTSRLIDFIYKFTVNQLSRHLRRDEHLIHSFLFNGSAVEQQIHPPINTNGTVHVVGNIRLTKIPGDSFERFVWQRNKTTVVLFTSTQCGFCKIFSGALLTVASILKEASFLKFGVIDADQNDLRWHLTMTTVPTLIVFHGNNQLESRKYPPAMKITTANVLRFILSNLSHPNRLKAYNYVLRYQRQQRQPIEPTLHALRKETEKAIVESLRIWRQIPLKRSYTLKRIQALRRLFLHIYSQTDAEHCDLAGLERLINDVANVWLHQ